LEGASVGPLSRLMAFEDSGLMLQFLISHCTRQMGLTRIVLIMMQNLEYSS
jgi:hypothetical protein